MIPAWLYTPRGGRGYVNQGPDRRIGGLIGRWLARTQRALSFHSTTPPFSLVWRWGVYPQRWKIGVEFSRPWLLPFVLVFLPRDGYLEARWWSFRAGWRWDANWGRGGYVADIIVKSRIANLVE